MKIFLILAILFFARGAFAHIEEGTYAGVTAQGDKCSMVAGKNYFLNNTPHPLNERIEIQVNNENFVVHHPLVVNPDEPVAAFNHDLFEGVIPTKTGALGLVIKMSHTETFEGPSEFSFIQHEYKTDKRSVLTCLNLQHE